MERKPCHLFVSTRKMQAQNVTARPHTAALSAGNEKTPLTDSMRFIYKILHGTREK